MAITNITTHSIPEKGITYTVITDSSVDWTGVTNDTYFYNKADNLPYYKNASGTVIAVFEEAGTSISGGTYSGGTLTLNDSAGGSVDITGVTTPTLYSQDSTIGSGRVATLTDTLTFETGTGGQVLINRTGSNATPLFKAVGYTASGTNPYFNIGQYGEVDVLARLNNYAFKVYDHSGTATFNTGGNGGNTFIGRSGAQSTVVVGSSISNYATEQITDSTYSFHRWYAGGIRTHSINLNTSNPSPGVYFYENGITGTNKVILGGNSLIGSEQISLQGLTLVADYLVQSGQTSAIADVSLANNSFSFHIDGGALAGRYKNNLGVVTDLTIGANDGNGIYDGSGTVPTGTTATLADTLRFENSSNLPFIELKPISAAHNVVKIGEGSFRTPSANELSLHVIGRNGSESAFNDDTFNFRDIVFETDGGLTTEFASQGNVSIQLRTNTNLGFGFNATDDYFAYLLNFTGYPYAYHKGSGHWFGGDSANAHTKGSDFDSGINFVIASGGLNMWSPQFTATGSSFAFIGGEIKFDINTRNATTFSNDEITLTPNGDIGTNTYWLDVRNSNDDIISKFTWDRYVVDYANTTNIPDSGLTNSSFSFHIDGGALAGRYKDSGGTVTDLTIGGADTNDYTTGTTLVGTTLYFDRTDSLSAYTADLSSIGGVSYDVCAIYNSGGTPTYYSDLSSAITAASAGETVFLFSNITETGATEITLKTGVNINLNGFTYEMSNSGTTLDAFTDNNVAVDVTIYNGVIKRSGASGNNARTLHIDNTSSKIKLEGVEVQSTFGYCIYNQGTVDGGKTSNTAGTYAVRNEGRMSNLTNSGFSGINQDGSGAGLYDCKSFTTGAVAIYFLNGEAYRCTGESSGGYGLHVYSTDIYDCIGESTSSRGIYCNSTSDMVNCTGISSASDGIYVQTANSYLKGCKGISTAGRGILTSGSGTNLYHCVGESSSSVGIYFDAAAGSQCVKSVGISTWNNAGGHGIQIADADGRVIDCYSEVANASAYNYQANGISPYISGCKGKGATTLINSAGNSQTNTTDAYGNILIN